MLRRAAQNLIHMPLPKISPLAVPVLLEIGRERVAGGAGEEALLEEAEALIRDAMQKSECHQKFNDSPGEQNMLLPAP
jgi:ATP-dependent Lhr-like helicase